VKKWEYLDISFNPKSAERKFLSRTRGRKNLCHRASVDVDEGGVYEEILSDLTSSQIRSLSTRQQGLEVAVSIEEQKVPPEMTRSSTWMPLPTN